MLEILAGLISGIISGTGTGGGTILILILSGILRTKSTYSTSYKFSVFCTYFYSSSYNNFKTKLD